MKKNIRLGEILVDSGIINEQQLESALTVQKTSGGKRLGDILTDLGVVSEQELLKALEHRLDVPLIELSGMNIPYEVIKEVPEAMARDNHIIPVKLNGNTLVIATNNPLNYDLMNAVGILNARNVEPALASKGEIDAAINRYYSDQQVHNVAENLSMEKQSSIADITSEELIEAENRAESAPIVQFINTIIRQAFLKRASDIHIEPSDDMLKIRLRIDGELIDLTTLNPAVLSSIVTRIKIMSGMDIAEKRIPLDGRFVTTVDGVSLSVRVSSMPTVYGEKIVMRVFTDNKKDILKVEQLGMRRHNLDAFYRLIKNPNGIILVTGPTGSGKTTTLYSILSEIAVSTVNVATIEDPVEKQILGVNQTQVNPKAGLTFASGLRALLRQDPDIIMIGEIRDIETADIASRAAITGHLVLSSLHTNNAASTYLRLVDMGSEPYIVASSVIGVVAQRLVKKICPKCKTEYIPTEYDKNLLRSIGVEEIPPLYYGKGCEHCNYTGHYGRTAVHEIIVTDNNIRNMILARKTTQDIIDYLRSKGQTFILDDTIELILSGQIALSEVSRINCIDE